jgi:hypothetical protein
LYARICVNLRPVMTATPPGVRSSSTRAVSSCTITVSPTALIESWKSTAPFASLRRASLVALANPLADTVTVYAPGAKLSMA